MTTTDTKLTATGQRLIEHRLDALDRALLGILPRSERLAFVAQVETRVCELADSHTEVESNSEMAMEPAAVVADAVSRGAISRGPKRRSRLALSSGILGIIALVMLFAMPITYLFVAFIGEELGEFVTISLLSIHVLTVAIGGLAALAMGIGGLVSLARRKGRLVGHGWAITGLCTAPLPTFIGGLLVLVTSLSFGSAQSVSVQTQNSPPQVVSWPANSPSSPMPASPGPMLSSNFPVSAAPTYCAPGDQPPQLCPAPGTELSTAGYQPAELRSSQAPTFPVAPATPSNLLEPVVPAPSSAKPVPLR